MKLYELRVALAQIPTEHDGEDVIIEVENGDGDLIQFPLLGTSYKARCADTPSLFLHTSSEEDEATADTEPPLPHLADALSQEGSDPR